MISAWKPSAQSKSWFRWKTEQPQSKDSVFLTLRKYPMKVSQHLTSLFGWFTRPFFAVSRLKRVQRLLESKLAFLREISALSNPRFGIDRTVGVIMEQLRVFYGANCCLLLSVDPGEGDCYLRRVDASDPESAMRKSLLAPELARLFLNLPATHATVHNAQSKWLKAPLLQCYDVIGDHKIAVKMPLDAKLRTLLENNSFVSVPLLHHGQALGRLFLTSNQRSFSRSDIDFIHQAVAHLVPILKNMEVLDRLASDAASEERLRIARDIHDSIVQPYIGLQMGIESLRQKVMLGENHLMPEIERLNQLCVSGTLELRSYVQQLKQARHDEDNLLASVHRLTTKFEAATAISVCVEAKLESQLHDRLAAEVLQMVAEGLSNIRRHTRSDQAFIRLRSRDGHLTLIIENHNENVSSATTRAGERSKIPGGESCSFTPVSLSERTWSLGGSIEVQAHQEGAIVTIKIPL